MIDPMDESPEATEKLACDLDSSVPDWVIEYPATQAAFQALGIDCSCGGKSLEYVCRERGLSVEAVSARLRQAIDAARRPAGSLESIQVGRPRTLGKAEAADPMDRVWTTGFFKEPVAGPVFLGSTNLAGDGQADLKHHGGPDKAVLAYSANHYAGWRHSLAIPDMPYGAFGENFTVAGLTEADVCIGDIWGIGAEAVVQVSQPRQPCWKLARCWRVKSLAAQVQQTGRTGWYFRVLREGVVTAGLPMTLQERPCPEWTVEQANRIMHHEKHDLRSAAELAALPPISASWRTTLSERVANATHDESPRLIGENG